MIWILGYLAVGFVLTFVYGAVADDDPGCAVVVFWPVFIVSVVASYTSGFGMWVADLWSRR